MEVLAKEWFWAMIQAVGVLMTLALIYRQMRLQTASHVVQTLGAIHHRWSEDAMLRARHTVCKRYIEGDVTFDSVSDYVGEFMEELGTYVKINAVPPDVMWDAQSWYVEHYYCMFKAGIEQTRQANHEDTLYQDFQDLFAILKNQSKRKGAPSVDRGPADLRLFAEDELRVTTAFLQLQQRGESMAATHIAERDA